MANKISKHTIEYNPFDIRSIRAAERELEEYKEWIAEKGIEVCKKLAEIGVSVAKIYFIPEAWNGNTDVTISTRPLNNGCVVVADGMDVCFMEFGAGVTAGLGYDTDFMEVSIDITPGSWSRENGGPFEASGGFPNGHWYYNGQWMNAIVPQMGMYHAAKGMHERLDQVAKEVFGS